MAKDERGYIVVETIVAFMLFVFLNLSILSLINIVVVQSRVHYALTQAAETMSIYSYTLEAMGAADHLVRSADRADRVEQDAATVAGDINGVLNALESMDLSALRDAGEDTYEHVGGIAEHIANDPKDVLQNLMNYGLQEGGSFLLATCMKPLMDRYLTNGTMSGDAFLEAFHVNGGLDGLRFYSFDPVGYDAGTHRLTSGGRNDSMLLDKDKNLKLVVEYDIDYSFGALPLPESFRGKLHVTQMVVTKSWLGGHGERYVKEETNAPH